MQHHLDGSGAFALDGEAPVGELMFGRVVDGRLAAGPGDFTLPFVFGNSPLAVLPIHPAASSCGSRPIRSSRQPARRRADPRDFSGLVCGHAQRVRGIILRDCPGRGTLPSCNCRSGSSGAALLSLLDTTERDCTVTIDEVRFVIDGFLVPDLDLDGDGAVESISIGLGIEGVRASFGEP